MKIYTKKGDSGQTGLFGGARVAKDHLRIQAYGTLDELNAVLGLALAAAEASAKPLNPEFRARLGKIQSELFQLGCELATPSGKSAGIRLLSDAEVSRLEQEIDAMESELSPLQTFVLPGGSVASGHLHLARTVCRRAERALVSLHHEEPQRELPLRYVNRLSDYLFVAARLANRHLGVADVPWHAEKA